MPTPPAAAPPRGRGRQFLLLSSVAFGLGFGAGGLTVFTLGANDPRLQPQAPRPAWPGSKADLQAALAPVLERVAATAERVPALVPPVAAGAQAEGIEAPVPDSGLAAAALPPPPAAALPRPITEPTPAVTEVELRRGDTLLDVLTRAGIARGEAHDAIGSLRGLANLRRLQVGTKLALELEPRDKEDQRRLARLAFPIDAAREVRLVRAAAGGFAASSVERPLRREMVRVRAEIADSVYGAATAAGLPGQTLGEMIKLLSWDVDFQRDVHPGDRFETVYERRLNEAGEAAAGGELLFVGLDARERDIEAYRFTTVDGSVGYFDRDGRAVRKWLLKTPVDGARLSSKFGPRRHPVLGYTRMHKGIDFAAPPGTPILAAGDGVIEFAGRNKGYGKYIRLRHDGEYGTAYAHLSRFQDGIKRGRRVKQGEVIGYVGSTGMSTGPHLHYEVLHRGAQVNPLGIKPAFADHLRGAELRRFLARRDEIDGLRRRHDREELVAQRGG